jgi:hypothetical protein
MSVISLFSAWWLALALVLLPIWWHRQKRQRHQATSLATAKFLIASEPQLLKIWRWYDIFLLLVRCLLLIFIIAFLAQVFITWRGDTVIVAKNVDSAWAEQKIKDAGMSKVARLSFCETQDCDLVGTDILKALENRQANWKENGRILVLANPQQIELSANPVQLQNALEIRIHSQDQVATKENLNKVKTPYLIQIVSEDTQRVAQWKTLFSTFNQLGISPYSYIVSDKAQERTDLMIWESNQQPDTKLRATIWLTQQEKIFPTQTAFDQLSLSDEAKYLQMSFANSDQGRIWKGNIDLTKAEDARAFYAVWQQLAFHQSPYFVNNEQLILPPSIIKKLVANMTDSDISKAFLALLIFLFALERSLVHARPHINA